MRASFDGLRGGLDLVTKGFGLLGIGIGIERIVSAGRAALDAAAGLGELAQQLGVTTDTLQTLQFAGTQAGVSTEQLETGIAKLTKTIGDAATGNKAAIDAFNALGVGVLDTQGKIRSTDAVLGDVAEALSKIPDPAKRAATEVDLFGRSGQRLDTILTGGRDGLRAYQREAQNTGQILSRDLIQQADTASDRIAAMESAWSKLAQTLVSKVAPALTYIAQSLTPQNLTVVDKIATLESQIRLLEQGGGSMRGSPTKIPLEALRQQLEDLREIQRLQQTLRPYSPPPTFNPAPAGAKGSGRAAGGSSRAADIEEIRDQTSALQEYLGTLQQEQQLLRVTGQVRAEYEALIRASAAAQTDYDNGLRDSPLLTGEEAAAIRSNADALFQMQQQAQQTHATISEGAQNAAASSVDLGSSLQSVTESLYAGATGAETWEQAWKSALNSIIQLMFQLLKTSSLFSGGSSGNGIVGSLFGSLLGAIGLGGSSGGLNSLSGGKALGAFAAGGRPPVGVPSLVGERGPELFVPDRAGAIIPSDFGGAGLTVVQHNSYDLRGSDISRTELDHRISKSQRETYGAVFKAIGRGGSESKAVGRRRK
jgi:hypothetical protein